MSEILTALGIRKGYRIGREFLEVLKGIDFSLRESEAVGIMGPSGVGKSTLLHILGGLDRPDQGEILLNGQNLNQINDGSLAKIRNEKIGFVFQFHHLLPDFSVIENISLPLRIRGVSQTEASRRAIDLASHLGLGDRLNQKPETLSAGERQRVAVARAVITDPIMILADEPTGNLDYDNSIKILDLLRCLNNERKIGLVIVSHNAIIREFTDHQFQLKGGHLSAL